MPASRPLIAFVTARRNPCQVRLIPRFEQLWPTWRPHGEYRIREYLVE
jgi:hypothetical protein